MGWPETKHCSICHSLFKGKGIDISELFNLTPELAYACSDGCAEESRTMKFPPNWKKQNETN